MVGTYVSILRRRALLIALLTAVLAPLGYLAVTAGDDVYQSEAFLLVGAGNVAEGVLGQGGGYEEPERRMATEVAVIEGRGVADRAAAALQERGWDESADDLAERVEASPRGLSSALEIVGTAETPERAQAVTQAFVDAYLEYRRDARRDELESARADLEARLEAVEAELAAVDAAAAENPDAASAAREAATAQYQTISGWLEEVRFRQSVDASGVELVAGANLPDEPEGGLNPAVAAALSLLGAALLACGVALAVDLVQDAVRTPAEAEDLVAQPVLVQVPDEVGDDGGWARRLGDPAAPLTAAARGLRLRLEDLAGGSPPDRIMVAGTPEDASRTLAVGAALAAAFGRAGSRTLLVADTGGALPAATGAEGSAVIAAPEAPTAEPTGLPGLWSAPATSAPDGPAGLLDAFSPRPALDRLAQELDVVVVVVPPSAQLAEAVAVGRGSAATVLVCALGRTGAKPLRRLASALERGGVAVSGLALAGGEDRGWTPRPDPAPAVPQEQRA